MRTKEILTASLIASSLVSCSSNEQSIQSLEQSAFRFNPHPVEHTVSVNCLQNPGGSSQVLLNPPTVSQSPSDAFTLGASETNTSFSLSDKPKNYLGGISFYGLGHGAYQIAVSGKSERTVNLTKTAFSEVVPIKESNYSVKATLRLAKDALQAALTCQN